MNIDLNENELILLISNLDNKSDLYKKLKNKLPIKKPEEMPDFRKEMISDLFNNKDEEKLIEIIKPSELNQNLCKYNKHSLYFSNDTILRRSIIHNMEKLALKLLTENYINHHYELLNSLAYTNNTKILNILLEKGIDINAYSLKTKSYPLNRALTNQSNDIAKIMIDKGANVSKKGFQEMTPLHCVKLVIVLKIMY